MTLFRSVLRVACRDLAGGVSVEDVGRELSYLAEGALRAATSSLEEEHPAPAGARFCVIRMGKLGGEELNYASDLDVLLDRKSTRLNSSHYCASRMPSSA